MTMTYAARPAPTHQERFREPIDFASVTADATLPIHKVKGRSIQIKRAMLSVPAGIAADASNYVNFKLLKGATVIANWSTQTGQQGALTALTPVEMVLSATAANLTLDDGDLLSLFEDVTGTITVPLGRIVASGHEL